MDLSNPVIELCQRGMAAESTGDIEEAKRLFGEAWEARASDYDACVAAHYRSRHWTDEADALEWHLTAIRHADMADPQAVGPFLPSLYLSAALSFEKLGRREESNAYAQLAARHFGGLGEDEYSQWIRSSCDELLRRLEGALSRQTPEER